MAWTPVTATAAAAIIITITIPRIFVILRYDHPEGYKHHYNIKGRSAFSSLVYIYDTIINADGEAGPGKSAKAGARCISVFYSIKRGFRP